MLYENLKREARDAIVEALEYYDLDNYYDLHNEVFNMEFYKGMNPAVNEYREEAKEILGEDVFDAVGRVFFYERDEFGEVCTNLSNPCSILNMLWYIAGQEVVYDSDVLNDVWNEKPTQELNDKLIESYNNMPL